MINISQQATVLLVTCFLCLGILSTNCMFNPQISAAYAQVEQFSKKALPNDEHKLLRYLLRVYDKSVRPVYNASATVVIQLGLTLTHIFNIVLSMNIWLEHEWIDERIQWNETKFGGLRMMTVPTKYLWTPDIVLYNNAEDFSHGVLQTNLNMYPGGTILWAPPMNVRSICKLDVTYFPFDEQICYLQFGSWIYDGAQVDVTNRSDSINLDSYNDNGEWEIVKSIVKRNVYSYPCCGDLAYPTLSFTLHLRRRTLFYVYHIIIPCVMLSTLTVVQFWLPCESGERVTLGLTLLVAYSVFSFNMGENMPETSDVVPLIAIYMMCIMSISAASVMLSVIVMHFHHTNDTGFGIPNWLKIFARISSSSWKGQQKLRQKPRQLNKLLRQIQAADMDRSAGDSSDSELSSMINHIHQHSKYVMTSSSTQGLSQCPLISATSSQQQFDLVSSQSSTKIPGQEPTAATKRATNATLVKARMLLQRIEAEKRAEEVRDQWKQTSRTCDKIFFWTVFLITLCSSIAMLVVAPYFSRQKIDKLFYEMNR